MFEIDVCYKFIFESMLEDDVLGYIANKVYEYTHAGIFFVSESGEILAYACSGKDQSMRSIIEGHVTLEDYPYFFEEVSPNGEFQTVAAVKDKKKNIGYIIIHYSNEEKHSLTVVLYQVSEKNAQKIYQMAQKENLNCYMSETFEDINDCRTKRDLLKQMERIPKICDVRGVKREKDWYLQGIFSYTLPLIEEAGLSDYSILNLIKEDEKNHTELYDTLKMYLLCENNVTMAAEKLHVHRNTLVYRLKQIKDCLELDINNNEISRELLAFMIMYDLSKSSED